MTWTLGEDLQEISVPYLIIEGNQSLTVRHSKVACCQPKPRKLTIYHWIRGELRLATLFKLKDCWTLMDQTRKHKVRQKNTDRQKKKKNKVTYPIFQSKKYNSGPSGQSYRHHCFSYKVGNCDKPSLVAVVTGTKHLEEQFLYKKWFRRLPAIKKSFKNPFGKSLLMEKAEAHHESPTFWKEQYEEFVEAGALQMWFYLKSRSLKTTGRTPRRHTGTSGILKRYHGIQQETN